MSDEQRTLFLGEKTIGRYGCFGCHEIKGFEKANPIGVELTEQGRKLVERLDFGYEHGQDPAHAARLAAPQDHGAARVRPRQGEAAGRAAAHAQVLRGRGRRRTPSSPASCRSPRSRCPLAAQKVLSADERHAEKAPAPRPRLQLPRLPPARHVRRRHPQGDRGAVGGVGRRRAAGARRSRRPCSTTRCRRSARARACTPTGCTASCAIPANEMRPWLDLRMPTFEFSEEQLNTLTHGFASLDKVPFPYAPRPRAGARDDRARAATCSPAGSA